MVRTTDEVVLVGDEALREATRRLVRELDLVVEPAGSSPRRSAAATSRPPTAAGCRLPGAA